eukprot:g31852.t1
MAASAGGFSSAAIAELIPSKSEVVQKALRPRRMNSAPRGVCLRLQRVVVKPGGHAELPVAVRRVPVHVSAR